MSFELVLHVVQAGAAGRGGKAVCRVLRSIIPVCFLRPNFANFELKTCEMAHFDVSRVVSTVIFLGFFLWTCGHLFVAAEILISVTAVVKKNQYEAVSSLLGVVAQKV